MIKDRKGKDLTEEKRLRSGKNTQSSKVYAQLCLGSSVHGISQARILGCYFLLQQIFLAQVSNLSPALTYRFFTTSATKVQNTQQTIQKRKCLNDLGNHNGVVTHL